ncbi:hypothetical protein ACR6C2_12465 [Streptomyces sp. INA 01156]
MAKNKNRERKQQPTGRSQQATQAAAEPQTEQHGPQITPGDVARKGRSASATTDTCVRRR